MDIIDTIKREWPVIAAAPWSFGFSVGATALLIWGAFKWSYGGVLSKRDAEIKLLERQISSLKDKPAGEQASPNGESALVKPNYTAWRHADRFTVSEAAHLWCAIEPKSSFTSPEARAWEEALCAAIRKDELVMLHDPLLRRAAKEWKQASPDRHAVVTRESLEAFAREHGYKPEFLKGS